MASTKRTAFIERLVFHGDFYLRNYLFHLLSKVDLVFLSRTSSLLLAAIRDYECQAWNSTDFLSYWFRFPLEFKIALASSGAVITGSQILRFFDRLKAMADSDLDVITRAGGVATLTSFLLGEGYRLVPRNYREASKSDYPALHTAFSLTSTDGFLRGGGKTGIIDILDFVRRRFKRLPDGGRALVGTLKVQVIVVTHPPIEHIMLTYHSTGVMNYMTHREAVSVFPKLTYEDRIFYVCSRDRLGRDWNPKWVDKYSKRGFSIVTDALRPRVETGRRSVRDRHCWVIQAGDAAAYPLLEAERSSLFFYDITSTFEFDAVWLMEEVDDESLGDSVQIFRLCVREPEVWYFMWEWEIAL